MSFSSLIRNKETMNFHKEDVIRQPPCLLLTKHLNSVVVPDIKFTQEMSRLIKFSPRLRELRIHLCQTSEASKGARDFICGHYPSLKQNNPSCPILIRECLGIEPKLWARYDGGRENSVILTNLKAEDILRQVELLTVTG